MYPTTKEAKKLNYKKKASWFRPKFTAEQVATYLVRGRGGSTQLALRDVKQILGPIPGARGGGAPGGALGTFKPFGLPPRTVFRGQCSAASRDRCDRGLIVAAHSERGESGRVLGAGQIMTVKWPRVCGRGKSHIRVPVTFVQYI